MSDRPLVALLVGASGLVVVVAVGVGSSPDRSSAAAGAAWLGLALLLAGAVGLVVACFEGRRRSVLFAALLALGTLAAGARLALETLEWCTGSLGCDTGDSGATLDAVALLTLGVGFALIPAASVALLVGRRNP